MTGEDSRHDAPIGVAVTYIHICTHARPLALTQRLQYAARAPSPAGLRRSPVAPAGLRESPVALPERPRPCDRTKPVAFPFLPLHPSPLPSPPAHSTLPPLPRPKPRLRSGQPIASTHWNALPCFWQVPRKGIADHDSLLLPTVTDTLHIARHLFSWSQPLGG